MINFLHVFGHPAAMKRHVSRLIVGRETLVRNTVMVVHVAEIVSVYHFVVRDSSDLERLRGYRFDLVTVDESFDCLVTDRVRDEFCAMTPYLTK